VERGIARGELRIVHRGVYVVGPLIGPHTLEMAAILACGNSGAISHRSGVHLHELLPYPARPGPVHVTVPGRHRRGDEGLVVHRTSRLARYEVRERHNIPLTAAIRTLIDFAGDDATDEELERAVAEAFALRLTQRAPMPRELEKQTRRRGAGRLRDLLDGAGPKRTRSTPERKLLGLLRTAEVPAPRTNVRVGRWEVDFHWPEVGLVVEVDAYSTHSSPGAFERDRRKTSELEDLGVRVHRVTKARIYDEPEEVVAEIRRRLDRTSPKPP
jgi:very-short-patch-repair endonuclease